MMQVSNPSTVQLSMPDFGLEDELQNVLVAEHKRTEQRIQDKTKNKGYTGYDDDEFAEGQAGMKKKVLAKYDDELNGAQEIVSAY
jgi:U4/U6.U5 tri-snRNP-associated protein 1